MITPYNHLPIDVHYLVITDHNTKVAIKQVQNIWEDNIDMAVLQSVIDPVHTE